MPAAAPAPTETVDPPDQTATTPPPAPQAENPGTPPTPTDTWAAGSWKFDQGKYLWEKGHWESRHEGATFQQARWVEANGHWEHHPARWLAPTAPRPGAPPPPPPRPGERPGESHPPEHR